jgi:hypothetical protein
LSGKLQTAPLLDFVGSLRAVCPAYSDFEIQEIIIYLSEFKISPCSLGAKYSPSRARGRFYPADCSILDILSHFSKAIEIRFIYRDSK